MIKKNDISEFFNLEADAAKKSWEALMSLPVKDRIRKRKAIENVFLDRDYRGRSDESHVLLKITVGVNLSDFKEGEYLLLHKENRMSGIKCSLYAFEGEDVLIIDVFPPDMPDSIDALEAYYDVPLYLDKDVVDLRESVYYPFLYSLPGQHDEFWTTMLINSKASPTFEKTEECGEELDDTIVNYNEFFKETNVNFLTKQREAIVKSIAAKDYYLIQGPPGTGKSFVLSWIILEEIMYLHHKVIVIGPNHMAINNALGQVVKTFPTYPNIIKVGQTYNKPTIKVNVENEERGIENINRINTSYFNNFEHEWVIGLTPHCLYTSRARDLICDTLIIDEAGQMTIPLALMGMIKAKKIILAGDHKQLPPIISSDEIKEEMKQSVFQCLMTDENCTMLDVSFRMCEPLCEYVSDIFYEGKVKAYKKGCGDMVICSDPLYSFDKPVVIHQVDDDGMQASDKEAEFIVDTIVEFMKKGLPSDEIAILSPFRAQAATVRRGIRKCEDISDEDKKNLVADTVDKMQGQEREVIIYSFTAGDPDYMAEMADFLYNPNKLNVAFSRAKSKLIIVGNMEMIKDVAGGDYPHIISMLNHRNVTVV